MLWSGLWLRFLSCTQQVVRLLHKIQVSDQKCVIKHYILDVNVHMPLEHWNECYSQKGPNVFFSTSWFQTFWCSRSLKCPLCSDSYTLRIGLSIMELYGTEFLVRQTVELEICRKICKVRFYLISVLML